jgi:predicted GNAT family acetyltransferase
MIEVINDKQGSRFLLDVDGEEVYVLYAEDEQTLDLYSTYTPPHLRGQGLAAKVVLAAFKYAVEKDLKIVPNCWYVRKFVERHTEYQQMILQH